VAGSSLYWASIGLRLLGVHGGVYPTSWSVVDFSLAYALLVACILLGFVALRLRDVAGGGRVLAGANLVVSFSLLAAIVVAPGAIEAHATAFYLVEMGAIGLFMMLWGMAFVSMDKRRAASNAVATALVTVLLVLACVAARDVVPVSLDRYAFSAASAAMLLAGRVDFENERRSLPEGMRRPLAPFVLERVAFGVPLGFLTQLAVVRGSSAVSPSLLVAACVGGAATLPMLLAGRRWLYAALPALLLTAVGLASMPFLDSGVEALSGSAAMLTWVVWCTFSAVQLSEYKERLAMSELDACLIDKVVLGISLAVGCAAYGAIDAFAPSALAGRLAPVVILCVLGVLAVGTALTIALLVSERQEDETRSRMSRTRRRQLDELYDRIAQEYALSTRERQVVELLAEGHTSSYIQDELGISQGTAKAHIAHIYQKLDVHRKDDLLRFINDRLSDV
jgi:DNA-binding CsgD family transcriptional regulator/heme/copper-type cytochrome/quinol oxidase subunit 4